MLWFPPHVNRLYCVPLYVTPTPSGIAFPIKKYKIEAPIVLPKSTVAVNKPLAEKDPSTPDPQGTKHSEHG